MYAINSVNVTTMTTGWMIFTDDTEVNIWTDVLAKWHQLPLSARCCNLINILRGNRKGTHTSRSQPQKNKKNKNSNNNIIIIIIVTLQRKQKLWGIQKKPGAWT